ncbi:MAG TPA: MBL fold metallo-hydrolase [Roseiflexaceae bacterium]|nr:MBL fold metallo-hydrolase [Roseiflexaceae bacterium]
MPERTITRHTTAGGAKIYRIPVTVFPHLEANVYVVVAGDYAALVDTGSGLGESDAHLRAGMEALREAWGERVGWADLRRIVVTHGHVDHYGGLGLVRSLSGAPLAVHELDRRVLTNHDERVVLAGRALAGFLRRAGLPEQRVAELMQMHGWSKGMFRPVEVASVLRDGDLLDGLLRVHHTPGHCPGQVCLMLDDVLLTADHVLPGNALFISPESITASTGLDHYLQALRTVAALPGVRLALPGHGEPIDDMYAAVERIAAYQLRRVEQVRELCGEPRTIAELTAAMYPGIGGYDALLALQKAGAYVEYLDQRGELAVANLSEVAADESTPPRYIRL